MHVPLEARRGEPLAERAEPRQNVDRGPRSQWHDDGDGPRRILALRARGRAERDDPAGLVGTVVPLRPQPGQAASAWAPKQMPDGAFVICRAAYRQVRAEQSGIGWMTDYPYAEINLTTRLSELTKTTVSRDGVKTVGGKELPK